MVDEAVLMKMVIMLTAPEVEMVVADVITTLREMKNNR